MGPSRSCWNNNSAFQPEKITSKWTSFMCGLSIKVPICKKSEGTDTNLCCNVRLCTEDPFQHFSLDTMFFQRALGGLKGFVYSLSSFVNCTITLKVERGIERFPAICVD